MIRVQTWLRLKNLRRPSGTYIGTTGEVIGREIIPARTGRVSESIDDGKENR